jgi:hypothetical protein
VVTDDRPISDWSTLSLPLPSFYGEKDDVWKEFLQEQDGKARNTANSKGYKNISIHQIAGKGHGPIPDEVLDYFDSQLHLKKE